MTIGVARRLQSDIKIQILDHYQNIFNVKMTNNGFSLF
jgi:hypothetical protein